MVLFLSGKGEKKRGKGKGGEKKEK